MNSIVIVGGGHAASQLCASLVEGGFNGRLTLVSEEAHPPYHRPPLSKNFLKSPQAVAQELRPAGFYDKPGVELLLATRVTGIDRANRRLEVESSDGAHSTLAYDHLVLATGARARKLPGLPEASAGIHLLRSLADALRLREALVAARRLAVVGGGFIGLEIAATSRMLGKEVMVIEAAGRLLSRGVSPELSAHLLEVHRAQGIDVRVGQAPERFEFEGESLRGVVVDGSVCPADALVIGIGAAPDTRLAEAAGLACHAGCGGIVVDEFLATEDPHVSAIGDCTAFPSATLGRHIRLESVQNANDQARTLAARLLGKPAPYAAVPTFWSDQGEARLQMAGLWQPHHGTVRRPGTKAGSFSLLHYEGEVLRAVESVNAPMDHLAAKRWLQSAHSPAKEAAADTTVALKDL